MIDKGNSLAAQWLGRHTFTAEAPGLILGRESEILQATQSGQRERSYPTFSCCCLVTKLCPTFLRPHEL